MSLSIGIIEMCHEKTDLKVFVVVIPKKSFSWDDTALTWCVKIVGFGPKFLILEKSVPKEGRFFWYDNDEDLKVCFLVTRVN